MQLPTFQADWNIFWPILITIFWIAAPLISIGQVWWSIIKVLYLRSFPLLSSMATFDLWVESGEECEEHLTRLNWSVLTPSSSYWLEITKPKHTKQCNKIFITDSTIPMTIFSTRSSNPWVIVIVFYEPCLNSTI